MKGRVLAILGLALLAAGPLAAATGKILLVARDLENRPLAGLRFAYGGVQSRATNPAGATELDLPAEAGPGQQITIVLVSGGKLGEDWFLVNSRVNIPTGASAVEVVLMRRSSFRQVAAAARDAPAGAALRPSESTAEAKRRALLDAAARQGITSEQLETAIASFAETQDPKDRGIASYLKGSYAQAAELLDGAAEKKEHDLVETLRYLGAARFEQAKYQAAADWFGKAIALRGEDAELLRWLGRCRYRLAEWTKAEPLMRRALAIDEQSPGQEHPEVGTDLNNLAQLLQDTNRPGEAEQMMRRALAIHEKSLGREHPEVATDLNNLAALLQTTNRLAEAELLMGRALAIDEKSFGPDHPTVATDLNNLAQVLQDADRVPEAEPLLRRALAIDEKGLGPDHPTVAIRLNNLATLLDATNRRAEAEPLMRRALAIDEKRFGPDHPEVAGDLNNLAQLLQAMNRLSEAQPLMRRRLVILLNFSHRMGQDHPNLTAARGNYADLLLKMGKSQAEVEAEMRLLGKGPQ